MKVSGIQGAVLAAAMALASGGTAKADSLGVDFNYILYNFSQTGPYYDAGYLFTPNRVVTVDALGAYAGTSPFPQPQQVGLWDVSGSTPVLLASTYVSGSETPVGNAPWDFESIAPVVLSPGRNYVVASQGGADLALTVPTYINPALDYEDGVFAQLSTSANTPLVVPNIINPNIWDAYGGNVMLAPEPSTWAMMLLGFGGLAFAGYRARKGVALAA